MAHVFQSGNAGDVYVGGTLTACVSMWKLDLAAAVMPIPTFQSAIGFNGLPWPDQLFGLATGTGSLEGWFDTDPTNATDSSHIGIAVGTVVTLDLIENKGSMWGYEVQAYITQFGTGSNINNQPNAFTAAFTVSGIVPRSAVVSP